MYSSVTAFAGAFSASSLSLQRDALPRPHETGQEASAPPAAEGPLQNLPAAPEDTDYRLTRIYEDFRSFRAEDQDSLEYHAVKPLVRIPAFTARPPAVCLADLQQLAPPREGQRSLGLFLHRPSGQSFFLRRAPSAEAAQAEMLSTRLAHLAGLGVPQVTSFEHGGQTYIARAYVRGLQRLPEVYPHGATDPDVRASIAANHPSLGEALVAVAWLNNRGAAGIDCRNVGLYWLPGEEPEVVFLNWEGALDLTARGGRQRFAPDAPEFITMAEPVPPGDECRSRPNRLIFGDAPRGALLRGLEKIEALGSDTLREEITRCTPDPDRSERLFETLMERRDAIRQHLAIGGADRMQPPAGPLQQVHYEVSFDYHEAPALHTASPALLQAEIEIPLRTYVTQHGPDMKTDEGRRAFSEYVQALAGPVIQRLMAEDEAEEETPAVAASEPGQP